MAQPPLQASGPPKEGRQQPHPPSEPLADQGPEDNTAPAATTTGSEAAGPAAVTTNANAAPAATPVLPVTLNGSAEGAAAAAAAGGPGTPAVVDAGAAQNPVAPTPTSSLLPPPSTDDAAVSTNGVEHNHTRHPTDASASYSVPVLREGSTDAAPSSTLDPTLYQQQQQQSPATEAATNGYDQNHAAVTNGGLLSSASSPSMSNPHQPHGLPRQNSGYSNPTSYSPPIMNPAQFGYGPPQPGQPGGDLYRTSPAPGVNPAMSLPSMRSIDPLQQQQAQQGIPVPIPPTIGSTGGPMGYYPMPGYGMHHDMRFAMPPPFGHDPRVTLSGGRHKKEIKRRTKTGCLTCRKRRIKCDETHPTCNNCKKSKRDCAGYDPIFKQQQGPLPTIQPALGSTQQQPPAPTTLAAAPTVPSSAPPPNPYAHHQAPVLASSYHTSSTPQGQLSYDPALSSAPPTAKQEGFEYPPAIDPALEGTARLPLHDPLRPLDYGQPKGGAPSTVLQSQESPLTYSSAPAKDMKVDELIALGGPAPPPPAAPPTREKLDEITNIYYDIYMTGLKEFFETTWFNFTPQGPNPISILHNNKTLMDLLTSFLDSLASIKSNDPSEMVMTGHLETRIVWALATLVYTIPAAINPPKDEPLPTNDATETRNRVAVFETLLSGGLLVRNPCMPPPKTGDPLRIREYEFWHWLGEYLRLQDTPQSNLAPQREQALARLRNLLDGRENRDILYSMVILRELSPQFPPGYEATLPKHLDETDPRSKLAVAAQFIRTEALVSGGTTNVVRRFAELAAKAFISPGANARRA